MIWLKMPPPPFGTFLKIHLDKFHPFWWRHPSIMLTNISFEYCRCNWILIKRRHCTMCILGSMFSFQPNKLRHILKFVSWYIIQHIFVPACSVGRKTLFSRKPWFSNSKFGIFGSFWPILSVPKIMPENEKQYKF